jgi:VWFA-related protein
MQSMRALVLAFCFPLAAQQPQFDVRSRLVLVPVTVSDLKGRTVHGLEPSDFRVLDNGLPQKITVDTIDTGVAPISLVMAVQSSGISAAVLEKTRKIGAMIHPMVSGERGCAALLSFDQRVSWLQECTKDADAFERAFQRLTPVLRPGEDKEARMLDAVNSAVEHLRKRSGVRRVLLLISESRDRGSEATLEAVATAAQAADVMVYAATYSAMKTAFTSKAPVGQPRRAIKPRTPNDEAGVVNPNPPGRYNPWPKIPPPERQVDAIAGVGEIARRFRTNTTEVLARSTGGVTFPFTSQKALEQAIVKLGAELHSQYVVSFVPEESPAGYHALEVRVARDGDFRIRARPGYWSTDEGR